MRKSTEASRARRAAQVELNDRIMMAIVRGIDRGEIHSKTYDKAISVLVALTDAGLRITTKPKRKEA